MAATVDRRGPVHSYESETVANTLRRLILSGELKPGAHIRQEFWAARHGVSRAPVRDALRILTAEDRIIHRPHEGYFVAQQESVNKVELYRIRQFLEPEIARSIKWPTTGQLNDLRQISSHNLRALLDHDVVEAMDYGQLLYFSIYERSPLELMVSEVKRYWRLADVHRVAFVNIQLKLDPGCRWFTSSRARMLQALADRDRESLVEQVFIGTALPLQRLLLGARGLAAGPKARLQT